MAIFQEKTDWGREMAAAWTEAGKSRGLPGRACSGEYAPGAKDFSDLILKAKAANADVVLALPNPPDGMTIVKQMKELGYNPKLSFFIRAPDAPPWSQNLGKDGDFMVLAAGWHHAMKGAGREGAERRAPEEVRAPGGSAGGPGLRVRADPGRGGHRAPAAPTARRCATRSPRPSMNTVIGPVKFRPDGTGIVQAGAAAVAERQAGAGLAEGVRRPRRWRIPAPPFAKR